MNVILHITTRKQWDAAQRKGAYRGDTLDTEGFIHNSAPDQLLGVARRFFKGRTGLVLLCINADAVAPEIRWEDPGEGVAYPHIYGPLNLDAVVAVVDFEPDADGRFALPDIVNRLRA